MDTVFLQRKALLEPFGLTRFGNVPKADPTDHREVAGQSDDTVAHMLGGRDALDLWGEIHALMLVVQVGTLRDDEAVHHRIVER